MLNHIVPECYIDTMLVKSLLKVEQGKRLNHQHGCFNVGKELEEGNLKDDFGAGVIDRDKQSVKYLDYFFIVDTVCYEYGKNIESLILWKHKNSKVHHYFVQICPAIERWIIRVCNESEIHLDEFRLPTGLAKLTVITKAQSSEHDERFIRLFKTMRQSEHIAVKRLQKWLKILVEKNYKLDINELKNG